MSAVCWESILFMTDSRQQKVELRRQLRARRQALSDAEQSAAAAACCWQLKQLAEWPELSHIGLYFARDGELDPRTIIESAWDAGKQLYLPVVAGQLLQFRHWPAGEATITGEYGLQEPRRHNLCREVADLDLLLLPLVAFDPRGNRLGMGGGFYDRCLATLDARAAGIPRVFGLGHSFQQLDEVPVDDWDQPLQGVITPEYCRRW